VYAKIEKENAVQVKERERERERETGGRLL